VDIAVWLRDLIGSDEARERAVVGQTPNLAARLQALAAPSTVVISQATRRLVGGLFELADLGPRRLKGFAEPLAAWQIRGEGSAEGRFEALHGEHLTPLVGREHEPGILLELWAWAKDGEGQVVLLSGEPGIGTSRLTRSLIERLADEPHLLALLLLALSCEQRLISGSRSAGTRCRFPTRRHSGGQARPARAGGTAGRHRGLHRRKAKTASASSASALLIGGNLDPARLITG
jgi:hypothetical protein